MNERFIKKENFNLDDDFLWKEVTNFIRPLSTTNQTQETSKVYYNRENPFLAFKNKDFKKIQEDSYNKKIISKKTKFRNFQIEDHIDLHGFNQQKSYYMLLKFLRLSYDNRFHNVLVITGKGSSSNFSSGVLKNSVPNWLNTIIFRKYIRSFKIAEKFHGGEGALYVKIKKKII